MGILNTQFLAAVSGSGSSPNAALVINVVLTSLLTSIYVPEAHSLLVSAVSWTTVTIFCFLIQRQTSRNGELQVVTDKKGRRKLTILACCILLSGICERVTGPAYRGKAAWWNKAGLPIATTFLRNHLLGEPGILESGSKGSKRVLTLIAIFSFFTLAPIFIPDTSMALGCSNIIFQALVFVLLEDITLGSGRDSKSLSGQTPDLKSIANSGYIGSASFAAIGFVVSAAYYERPLEDYAFRHDMHYPLWRMVAIGVIGGIRWLCMPLLVAKFSSPTASLLDLAVTLIAGVLSAWTSVFQLLGTTASLGFIGFHFIGTPSNRDVLPQRFGSTRAIAVAAILFLIIPLFVISIPHTPSTTAPPAEKASAVHPIKHLMEQSAKDFEALKQRQSTSLRDAVKNYKKRYGMPPPPNFDKWYEFAVARNSLMIDEYDTIFHQIQPFWGMPPKMIRDRAREALGFKQALIRISVRDRKVIDAQDGDEWQRDATVGMIEAFKQFLPDMDLAFNTHDEPRVVVPTEEMSMYVNRAKGVHYPEFPKNTFTGFPKEERGNIPETKESRFNEFAHQAIWGNSKLSCPPGTPARDPLEETPDATDKFAMSPIGFIKNRTASMDICLQPSLRNRFGFFQRPNAYHVSHNLFPIFSQSKVSCYNDLVYPSPWYWAGKVSYDGEKDTTWDQKKDSLYWRGSTTGGFSRNGGWRKQHRQRVVRELNALNETSLIYTKSGPDKGGVWETTPRVRADIGGLIDVKFSHIGQCDPDDCDQQKEFFHPTDRVEQQDAWSYKYLLDMDGNAFSGRFYAFLLSHSAVFKMALFKEWHEEWLMPWVHYIPLSLDMGEAMEVMRYFTQDGDGAKAIKAVAEDGRYWAGKVLRKEDFEVWFFRLLLEYGRVIDDNREHIGFDA